MISASFAVFLRLLVKLKHAGIAVFEAAPKRHGDRSSKKRNTLFTLKLLFILYHIIYKWSLHSHTNSYIYEVLCAALEEYADNLDRCAYTSANWKFQFRRLNIVFKILKNPLVDGSTPAACATEGNSKTDKSSQVTDFWYHQTGAVEEFLQGLLGVWKLEWVIILGKRFCRVQEVFSSAVGH